MLMGSAVPNLLNMYPCLLRRHVVENSQILLLPFYPKTRLPHHLKTRTNVLLENMRAKKLLRVTSDVWWNNGSYTQPTMKKMPNAIKEVAFQK
jgi:hypothetical protein